MVPACRNIQNCAMISLMRPIFRNTGDVLKKKLTTAFER
jgi:hypothetical protein